MENLKYVIEDKIIAEILGNQNFSTKESAVLELVKNAYDAGATEVELEFAEEKLFIKDNGCGMDSKSIKENWMYVGRSAKDYEFVDTNNNERIYAGSKGIGRFALSRLGAEVSVYSKMEHKVGIHWYTDWESSTLEKFDFKRNHGTQIWVSKLRDRWTEKSIELLKNFLSRTYNSDLMEVRIVFNGETHTIEKYFGEAQLGVNCLSYIDLNYNSESATLTYYIYSDEFSEEAEKYCSPEQLKYFSGEVNMAEQLSNEDIDVDAEEIPERIKELGSFKAKIFFSMKGVSDIDIEKFCYKHKELIQRYKEGIILYRNAFSIASFEGRKDWLELGKRSRKSPAAATHETGSWRVRENQVSGYVEIDKKGNEYLRDLSNRQGVEENIHYKLFVKIIQKGISEFESYRQNIIRLLDKKNAPGVNQETPYIDQAVKAPKSVLKLNENEIKSLVKEIKQVKKEQEEGDRRNKTNEERYKYDIRILNMLSTIGLRASSIAHDMQNDRNNISDCYSNIIDAMKDYDVWDIVNDPQNRIYAYRDIPRLLKNNKKINEKIIRFMDAMLSNIEKNQFLAKECNIVEILKQIKDIWERDYSWVTISIPENSVSFTTAEDAIKVLIDNLVLNSIQQNANSNTLKIEIDVNVLTDGLFIKYKDNGCGLPKKYQSNPRKILEVHETSRRNGHGLGMWIINNTLVMSGGKVIDIPVKEGFEIQMILGDKL